MSSSVTQNDQSAIQGHCSKCRKVWTLKERQGVCQWCGKPAIAQTATRTPRHIKSNGRRKQRQANGNGNGYDRLDGDYLTYYKVVLPFSHKAKVEDTEDLLHDIILTLARANGHKPLTEAAMYRIASRRVADYWRDHYKLTNGLTCCNCSKAQRQSCREDDLYSQCPKAIKIESLNKPVIDPDGNMTEFGELIADDHALDLDAWVSITEQLLHTPDRLLAIAGKIQDGEVLTNAEMIYLCRYRKREQKRLF